MKKNNDSRTTIALPDMSDGISREAIFAMIFVSVMCVAAVFFEVI